MTDIKMLEGDCLDCLKDLPGESVNLIFTSPPYAQARKATYGGVDAEKYVEWFLPRSEQFMRVLNPRGSFCLNIKEKAWKGERQTYVYELVLALREQGWRWVEEYCWHKKSTWPGKWRDRFRDGWERVYHFTKQPDFDMWQDVVKIPASEALKQKRKLLEKMGARGDEVVWNSKSGAPFGGVWYKRVVARDEVYPSNVLFIDKSYMATWHSAVFPKELPSWFIRLFTLAGDTVLDPFAGSGTTLFVARLLQRNAIGIEIVPEYVERVRGELAELPAMLI